MVVHVQPHGAFWPVGVVLGMIENGVARESGQLLFRDMAATQWPCPWIFALPDETASFDLVEMILQGHRMLQQKSNMQSLRK